MKKILILSLLLVSLDLMAQSKLKKPIPDKLVVLTFDDAVKSQYNIVAPLLCKYGFGATFYVCEFRGTFGDTSNSLSWAEIKQLSKWGFDIGNHTWHHANINGLTNESFIEELSYINRKCDSLHIPRPKRFAYPAYVTDSSKINILKKLGYITARVGGEKPYYPEKDNPFYIPSFTPVNDLQKAINAIRKAKDGGIVILTIHGVPDNAHSWVSTSPETFEAYLKYLKDNHYTVISMRGLEKYINFEKNNK